MASFTNHSHSSNNKNKRYRSLRIEELESRDLLSVSPFGNDYDNLDVLENSPYDSAAVCNLPSAVSTVVSSPVVAAAAPIPLAALAPGEFDAIKAKYADLGLTIESDYNIIEITASELGNDSVLRSKINTANTNGLNNLIVVHTTTANNEITLSGQLSVSGEVTIVSMGETNLTIEGDGTSRIFKIDSSATVGMAGLNIINGKENSSTGGGIYNEGGTLTLTHCTISENEASDGGGIANIGGALTLTHCTIAGNSAGENGGGIYNHDG